MVFCSSCKKNTVILDSRFGGDLSTVTQLVGEGDIHVLVLVDKKSLIDKEYLAEPGFSVLIEEDGCRILFDIGYSPGKSAIVNH